MRYKLLPIKNYGWSGVAWTDWGIAALTLPSREQDEALAELAGYLNTEVCLPLQEQTEHYLMMKLQQALTSYFAGQPTKLNFPVDLRWCTSFQRTVLQHVKYIPYGRTTSYGQVAKSIGQPSASRAVGGALGANRVLLVIPCHRVVRSDGELGGFGRGRAWKKKLLALEGAG